MAHQQMTGSSSQIVCCFWPHPPTWCSWCVPGRKPGTSTNVMIGMLKASQKRMNLHTHKRAWKYSVQAKDANF
jgi:hypothetical protein